MFVEMANTTANYLRYQCQMGKQTMALPLHSFRYRVDNKLYRIQTPHVTYLLLAML